MAEIATFAGGCFWCTEAVFAQLKGVLAVMPGYSGGDVENPSYEQVVSGKTGHAESIQVTFDPKIISYEDLLYVFFKLHDPTQLNRQGPDVGEQYRSVVFYHSEEQRKKAEEAKEKFQKDYSDPIVTEIVPYKNFYPAEEYHRQYYFKNKNQSYCRVVIDPKIQKLKKEFGKYLKQNAL